jgi:molecular chaperone GrpE (heat shock protein)
VTGRRERAEAARAAAREALRESARARRESTKAGDESREHLLRLALAAVEGLEALAETAAACAEELPQEARETVGVAVLSAWERLAAAGVRLDGEVGEAVDLARHRVVKRLGPSGPGSDVVAEVVSRGALINGTRMRAAAVAVRRTNGTHRD